MNSLNNLYPYLSLIPFMGAQVFLYSTQLMHRLLRRAGFIWLVVLQTLFFTAFFVGNKCFLCSKGLFFDHDLLFLFFVIAGSLGAAFLVSDFSFEPDKGLFIKKRWWLVGVPQEFLFERIVASFHKLGADIVFEEKNTKIIAWVKQENSAGVIFELTMQKWLNSYVIIDFLCYPESKGFYKEKYELEELINVVFKSLYF